MAQAQSNGIPKFGQQKTINLNFVDDLNIGLDNESRGGDFQNDKPDQRFQDPNFSVIYKNPNGNEFFENADYEDSKDLDTPANFSSAKDQLVVPILPISDVQSPQFQSRGVSPNLLNQMGNLQDLPQEPDDQQKTELNSALNIAGIMQRSGMTNKQSNGEYNTQNQDSEGDQFIHKLALNSKSQNKDLQLQTIEHDSNYLKPRSRGRPRSKKGHSAQNTPNHSSSVNIRKFEVSLQQFAAEQDNSDILKRFEVDINEKPQQDERRARQMIINKLQDFQNKRSGIDDSFFMIVDKLPIERVDDMKGRCSNLRKCLCISRININHLAHAIIKSKVFEAISLLVIVANSISLAIEDPTDQTPEAYQESMDTAFLVLYSIEMVLKILGLGFVFNKDAYLRDAWNVLDFTIVMTGYLQIMLQGASFNLSGLRAFRVLRPLKSISSIEGLKVIVLALLSSLPLLRDTVIVLLFFFFIFAIAGLQLFSGYLKRRCVNIETGIPHPDDDFCGFKDCDPGYFCGKRNENPNFGMTNFDTIFYSLIAIFTSVTLEGWTSTMHAIDKSFTNISFIFFIPLVFIGAFFLMNLTLAVIKSKFTTQHEQRKIEKEQGQHKKKKKIIDYIDHEYLLKKEDFEQKVEEEIQQRSQVLKKWRMILFIKEKIRNRIRQFKEKKATHNGLLGSGGIAPEDTYGIAAIKTTNKTTNITSTALLDKGIDYGVIFGSYLGHMDDKHSIMPSQFNNNYESDSQHNISEQDGQQSQRQLLQNQQRLSQQIQLGYFNQSDEKKRTDNQNTQNSNKITIQNLRQLDENAIVEEDDEYKTEFSNIVSSLKHINKQKPSQKKIRDGSNGSKSTPKSNQDPGASRKSSSKLNFQFLINNQINELPIEISSPEKKIKILGMQGVQKNVNNQSNRNNDSQRFKNKRKIKQPVLNDDFFRNFIQNDLETLEQIFSEQQLKDIAEEVDNPLNYEDESKLYDLLDEDLEEQVEIGALQQFSEVSILTDNYYRQGAGNGQNYQRNGHQSEGTDTNNPGEEKNDQTQPYNSITAHPQQKSGGTFFRQRSKNTAHYYKSQGELSISDIYEEEPNDVEKVDQQIGIPNNQSPNTYQSLSNDNFMSSNEILLNRQQTDFTATQRDTSLAPQKLSHFTQKKGEENITDIKQQYQSEQFQQHPLFTGQKTIDFMAKRKKMGSSKIIPYNINSFDPLTIDQLTKTSSRHGPNTIMNQDSIPVEQSVLNSRYLISNHLLWYQKVYLKKEKFDFQKSSEDVFEQRNKKMKEKIREEKRLEATQYSKNWKIKPYSKKLKFSGKVFKADEDQAEYLHHLGLESHEVIILIQQQFDEAYITNLYVTGTLSIAINDRKDNRTNKTRKIQNTQMSINNYDEQEEEPSFHQSLSVNINSQFQNGGTNQSIQGFSSPMRRKTLNKSPKSHMRILTPQEQLAHDVKMSIFVKATTNPQLSKSMKTNQSNALTLKKKVGNTQESGFVDSQAKRALLLQRQAAKDPKLQRKLILSGINKDANRSNLFRMIVITRKNRVTQNELQKHPHLQGMLDIYEGEDDEEESEEEEESSDEDDIKDDFLDWPIDCKTEVLKAKKQAVSKKQNLVQWSGQDVLENFDPSHAQKAINSMSVVRVWPKMYYGYYKKFQVPLKNFVKGTFFDNFMTLAVTINTVALALDKYGISEEDNANLATMNTVFTWIFIFEMVSKIVGLGPIKYFKDRMNYLDCIVVLLSIVEMSFLSNSGTNLSAFRSIRIFRTFRVLRVARLLKSMQSMQVIMGVLLRSMDSFIYLALLLLLFIFIYALLGMQIFGNNFNFQENFYGPGGVPRTNFNSFNSAFLTTFQILTLEAWPALLYDALRSPVSQFITALYFISWVFLGNFMLLNLFLAILLDSFTEEAPHKKNVEEKTEKQLQREHLEKLEKKQGQELIEYYQEEKAEAGDNKKKVTGLGGKKKKKKKKKDENMLDESFEFDKDILTRKVTTKKKKADFENVECEKSFYILSKKNIIRIYLYRATTHTGFETIILILIIFSSIKLVIDTYIFDVPDDDPIQLASKNIDYFFTAVFALESFLKAFAFGFIQDKGSYLRETWSQLDFFIVTTSIIDASFENINLPIIKILRLLRTLRPLRFISHNSGMKTIVVALIGSVGGIVNVLIVVVVVWMMFAILAVNFFGGKLQYCTIEPFLMQTKTECLKSRGEWKTFDYNFDSVPQAMITLFSLATLENWPDIMYNAINIQGLEMGPKLNDTPQNGYFFVIYILIGSFLFLNLFVGVIFKEFSDAQEEEKASMMLKENQMKWVDIMKMIVNANPDLETTNRPKSKWRAAVHAFMTGEGRKFNFVDIFVMACIVLNMFQMAVDFEGSSAEYNKILEYINYFFTGVFVIECVLKLIAFGFSYFKNSWNVFDFCVVCASILDIAMGQLSQTSLKFLRVGPQLARVMRVLRVSRLFRLINKYKGLQALIQTITFSLPSLLNVFSLLMLVYFIFAVLATFLFRNITEGQVIDDYTNFSNFSYSLMTLIRMSTGEDWNYVMYDCMRTPEDGCIEGRNCGVSYAPAFFITYMMISTFIMLNLFILVIIQQFELYYLQDDNVLEKFKENLELFKKTWTQFTREQNCLKIKDTKLVAFFRSMKEPLGMNDIPDKDIIKNIVLMELVSDEEGFIYFNELLYRAMRRVYGEARVKNKILVDHEIRTMKKIEEIKLKMKKKSWQQEKSHAAQVNPFMLQMYMNISFKAWLKHYRETIDRKKSTLEQEGDNMTVKGESEPEVSKDEPSQLQEQDPMGGWEYKTEEDIEVSDDESYYEEDENSDEEYEQDQNQDNSRMLRKQKQVSAVSILALKIKEEERKQAQLDRIFKHKRQPTLENYTNLSKRSGSIVKINSVEDREIGKRLSTSQNKKANVLIDTSRKLSNGSNHSSQREAQQKINFDDQLNQASSPRQPSKFVYPSTKKKDNVVISSRSGGSQGEEENIPNQKQNEDENQQNVLLKVQMDSQKKQNQDDQQK